MGFLYQLFYSNWCRFFCGNYDYIQMLISQICYSGLPLILKYCLNLYVPLQIIPLIDCIANVCTFISINRLNAIITLLQIAIFCPHFSYKNPYQNSTFLCRQSSLCKTLYVPDLTVNVNIKGNSVIVSVRRFTGFALSTPYID